MLLTAKKWSLPHKWLTVGVVVAGTFTVILNNTTITVAVPVLMEYFNAPAQSVQWVLAAFAITMGAVIPMTGYLTDVLGMKRAFIGALGVFVLGAVLATFSWSLESLIAGRVVQGVGGGVLMPLGMAIILTAVSPDERGLAFGISGVAIMVAPSIGPTLSGYILEFFNWRWVLGLNIPVGLTAMAIAALLLQPGKTRPDAAFDWAGTLTIAIATVSLLFGFSALGAQSMTPVYPTGLLAVSLSAFALFIWIERRHPQPALDLRVFASRTFSVSMIITVFNTIGLFGGIFLLPILLQSGLGYGPFTTGMLMAPQAVAMALTMPIAGRLFDRLGPIPLVPAGLITVAATSWLLSRTTLDTSVTALIVVLVLRGIGTGLSMTPNMTAGMNTVRYDLLSRAASITHVNRQVSASLGIVAMTAIYGWRTGVYTRTLDPATAVERQAVLLAGMNDTFLVVAVVVAAIIPFSFLLRDARFKAADRPSGTPENTAAADR